MLTESKLIVTVSAKVGIIVIDRVLTITIDSKTIPNDESSFLSVVI